MAFIYRWDLKLYYKIILRVYKWNGSIWFHLYTKSYRPVRVHLVTFVHSRAGVLLKYKSWRSRNIFLKQLRVRKKKGEGEIRRIHLYSMYGMYVCSMFIIIIRIIYFNYYILIIIIIIKVLWKSQLELLPLLHDAG